MAISKVIFNGDTLMDVTGDNPATDNMLTGTRATGADGVTVNGAVVTAPASTADPAMDGTASPGTASTYSRGDHVHPTDTSRAPTAHASSATTYGTGTSSYYGHLKLSDSTSSTSGTSGGIAATPSAVKSVKDSIPSATTTTPKMDGTAAVGSNTTWAKGDHVHPTDTSRAPTSHASSATTYGTGTSSNYGHVKLSDSTSSTSGTSGGVAATPSAVKAVMDAIPSVPTAYTSNPAMDGTASAGSSTSWAKGDHVHPTDTSRAAASDLSDLSDTLATYVRPNLLDNWYFVGGGSQQGGGQFPINQRGETSYSGAVYGVDRWKAVMANSTVSIQSAGLRLTATASLSADNSLLYQVLENPEAIAGKTVTLSLYVSQFSGSTVRVSIRYVLNGTATNNAVNITGAGFYTVTSAIPSGVTEVQVCFLTLTDASMASGSYFTIEAVKLEVGSTQTLAHQENGVWVLNEVPNYQQELAKCQRYFLALDSNNMFPPTRFESTNIDFVIPVPVTMRAAPTIIGTPAVYSGTSKQTGFTFGARWSPGSIGIRATKSNHGLTDNGIALYCSGVSLSADL